MLQKFQGCQGSGRGRDARIILAEGTVRPVILGTSVFNAVIGSSGSLELAAEFLFVEMPNLDSIRTYVGCAACVPVKKLQMPP